MHASQNHLHASQNHLHTSWNPLCSGAGLILHCRSPAIWKCDGLKFIQVWSKLLMSMQQWRASQDRSVDGPTEGNDSLKLNCVFSLGVCVYTLKLGMNSSFYSILFCIKIWVTALGWCNHICMYCAPNTTHPEKSQFISLSCRIKKQIWWQG